jgi:HD-GYP domain-containing protein (c-di-GMP phosphodiesterase class II)
VSDLRLAGLLAGLSLAADLGMGDEPEKAVRTCLVAVALARRLGLAEEDVADVYYTALLQHVGCTGGAHDLADVFGDDLAANHAGDLTNFADPRDILRTWLREIAPDAGAVGRLRVLAATARTSRRLDEAVVKADCEVARQAARRLDLPEAVQRAVHESLEWWNGKGGPQGLAGEEIALPARIVTLASKAELFHRVGGIELAADAVRRRSGGYFDPALVEAFVQGADEVLAEPADADPWAAVLAAEPAPVRLVGAVELDRAATVFGELADLKAPFLHGHASGVARLAEGAGRELGVAGKELAGLRCAALLHDLGRVAVPSSIWEKPGRLSAGEWERVRLHAYHSERILSRSEGLAEIAPLAGMHHERLDGSGYHRAATSKTIPMAARVLAAADVFQALTADRPHRPGVAAEQAAGILGEEAAAGRLDAEAVGAVCSAAGEASPAARREWPAGLTAREVDVLRLVARGLSIKQIARELVIAPKTAEHHVQHIYAKAGVSTRASAAVFAMEHDLLA